MNSRKQLYIILFILVLPATLSSQNFFKKLGKDAGKVASAPARAIGNAYQQVTAPTTNLAQNAYKNTLQGPVNQLKSTLISNIPGPVRDFYKYEIENRLQPYYNNVLNVATSQANIVDGTQNIYDHTTSLIKEFALTPTLIALYTTARAAAKPVPTEILDAIRPHWSSSSSRKFQSESAKYIVSTKIIDLLRGYGSTEVDAMTFFDVIIFKEGISTSPVSIALVAHEMVHIDQYHDLGFSQFLATYIAQNLTSGYENSAIEKEAYKVQTTIAAKIVALANTQQYTNPIAFNENLAVSSLALMEASNVDLNKASRLMVPQAQTTGKIEDALAVTGYIVNSAATNASTKAFASNWMAYGPLNNQLSMANRLNWAKASVAFEPENPENWYYLAGLSSQANDPVTEFYSIINFSNLIIKQELEKSDPDNRLLIYVSNLLMRGLQISTQLNWNSMEFFDPRLALILLVELGTYLPPNEAKDQQLTNFANNLAVVDTQIGMNDELHLRSATAIAAGALYLSWQNNRLYLGTLNPNFLAGRRQTAATARQLISNALQFINQFPGTPNANQYNATLNGMASEAASLVN